jgi:hypothetical protein
MNFTVQLKIAPLDPDLHGAAVRALRTSSAVGVSPNHFWSTSSARAFFKYGVRLEK